jgi:hypothetical protein
MFEFWFESRRLPDKETGCAVFASEKFVRTL